MTNKIFSIVIASIVIVIITSLYALKPSDITISNTIEVNSINSEKSSISKSTINEIPNKESTAELPNKVVTIDSSSNVETTSTDNKKHSRIEFNKPALSDLKDSKEEYADKVNANKSKQNYKVADVEYYDYELKHFSDGILDNESNTQAHLNYTVTFDNKGELHLLYQPEEAIYNDKSFPEYNISDPALKSCILRSLNLEKDEIPTEQQMLSLIAIYCQGVKTFNGLESWDHLKILDVRLRDNTDLSALSDISSLEYLKITGIEKDVGILNLDEIKSLKVLLLDNIPYQEIISNLILPNLEAIFINESYISNLDKIQTYKTLHVFKLNKVVINKEIGQIIFPNSIEKLSVVESNLTSMEVFQNIDNIYLLDLSHNKIEDISGIEMLTKLRSIDLSYNKITDISYLKKLREVVELNFNNNKIEDISVISKLYDLIKADFKNNEIKIVPIMEEITVFVQLDLQGNPVEGCIASSRIKCPVD